MTDGMWEYLWWFWLENELIDGYNIKNLFAIT